MNSARSRIVLWTARRQAAQPPDLSPGSLTPEQEPRRFARVAPATALLARPRGLAMAQVERKRVVEHEGTLPDGREVKRVTTAERTVATPTEARAGATGQGVSPMLLVSLG